MSAKKTYAGGFERDEEGNLKIVPMKIPDALSLEKSDQKKQNTARKFMPLERLNMKDLQNSLEPPSKKVKPDKSIRKELFKVPSKVEKPVKGASFTNKNSTNTKNNTSVKKKVNLKTNSNAFDFEKEEDFIKCKNLIKETKRFPKLKVDEQLENSLESYTPQRKLSVINEEAVHSPDSLGSEMEFIQIEKTFTSVYTNENKTKSPISLIYTKLHNAKINNSSNSERQLQIIEDINSIFEDDENKFNALKKQMEMYEKEHQENMSKIKSLINEMKDLNKENKDNGIDTNLYISNEVISSASKKFNLRKTTLNKNFIKNLECEPESPRMKKAVDMYNNFKSDFNILCTPKLTNSNIDVTQKSITRSLSRRIQKQCLLLQDSPKP